MKTEKKTAYTYMKAPNVNWLKRMAYKHNTTMSNVADTAIESIRLKKDFIMTLAKTTK